MFIKNLPLALIRSMAAQAAVDWRLVVDKCKLGDSPPAVAAADQAAKTLIQCGAVALPTLISCWCAALSSEKKQSANLALSSISFIDQEIKRLALGEVRPTLFYFQIAQKLAASSGSRVYEAGAFYLPVVPDLEFLERESGNRGALSYGSAAQASADYSGELQKHVLAYFQTPSIELIKLMRQSLLSIDNRHLTGYLGLSIALGVAWLDSVIVGNDGLKKEDVMLLTKLNNWLKQVGKGNDVDDHIVTSSLALRITNLKTRRAAMLTRWLSLGELLEHKAPTADTMPDSGVFSAAWQQCATAWEGYCSAKDAAALESFNGALRHIKAKSAGNVALSGMLDDIGRLVGTIVEGADGYRAGAMTLTSDLFAAIWDSYSSMDPNKLREVAKFCKLAVDRMIEGGAVQKIDVAPTLPLDAFYKEISDEIAKAERLLLEGDHTASWSTLDTVECSLAVVQNTKGGASLALACQRVKEIALDEAVAHQQNLANVSVLKRASDLMSKNEQDAISLLESIRSNTESTASEQSVLYDKPEDIEIFEIFMSEALEIGRAVHDLCNAACVAGHITIPQGVEMRRHWHTLKGSARMAGLSNIGDCAYEIENALTECISNNEIPFNWAAISLPAVDTLVQACRIIERDGRVLVDVEEFKTILKVSDKEHGRDQTSGLVEPVTVSDFPDTNYVELLEESAQQAEVAHGNEAIDSFCPGNDADVMAAFSLESQEMSGLILAEAQNVRNGHVRYELIRAAHCLAGMSRIINFVALEQLAEAVEQWSTYHFANPEGTAIESRAALLEIAKEIDLVVCQFNQKLPYSPQLRLINELLVHGYDVKGAESLQSRAPQSTFLAFEDEVDTVAAALIEETELNFMSNQPLHVDDCAVLFVPEDAAPERVTIPEETHQGVVMQPEDAETERGALPGESLSPLQPAYPLADSECLYAPTMMMGIDCEAPLQEVLNKGEAEDIDLGGLIEGLEITDHFGVDVAAIDEFMILRQGEEPVQTAITLHEVSNQIAVESAMECSSKVDGTYAGFESDSSITDDVDQDVLVAYIAEAEESLAELDGLLEKFKPGVTSFVEINRLLHTLKGGARLCGLLRLGSMLHRMEDATTSAGSLPTDEAADLIHRIQQSLDHVRGVLTTATGPEVELIPSVDQTVEQEALPLPVRKEEKALLRIDPARLDVVSDLMGRIRITQDRVNRRTEAGMAMIDAMKNPMRRVVELANLIAIEAESRMDAGAVQQKERQFDALEMDRFTLLQEYTRRLQEAASDIGAIYDNTETVFQDVSDAIVHQMDLSNSAQNQIDNIGRSNLHSVESRMKAVVRQSAEDCSKQCKLEFEGVVSIERAVMDRLVPALEHMIRNSVAHGIEAPQVRTALGKPDVGTITVTSKREGSYAVVSVSDDGGGIDFGNVEKKAITKGLLRPNSNPSEAYLTNLLFTAGFSTAEKINSVAGRGVGLDAVRDTIARMGGRVTLKSRAGLGSEFQVLVPLASGYVSGLLIQAGDSPYIIPSALVQSVEMVGGETLKNALQKPGAEVMLQGGIKKYLYEIGYLCGVSHKPHLSPFNQVLVSHGHPDKAIYSDSVEYINNLPLRQFSADVAMGVGVVGYSLLSDGRVAVVIDPDYLLSNIGHIDLPLAESKTEQTTPLILVVDDSITVRAATSRLLVKNGYRVKTAENGAVALEKMQEEIPRVILLDIEMPVMDGFETTNAIKADDRLKRIPLAMISSRNADKHRSHAESLGVDEFFGKPYKDVDLLEWVRGVLQSELSILG